AAALVDDLQRFLEDRPVRARRVSETERLWRWCRRNPLPASLLAGIVLVFLTGFALVVWQWRGAGATRRGGKGEGRRGGGRREEAPGGGRSGPRRSPEGKSGRPGRELPGPAQRGPSPRGRAPARLARQGPG